ncbi:MAG: hypothetical protein QOJ40_2189, partial [Verrucomicrobiota bacterium]
KNTKSASRLVLQGLRVTTPKIKLAGAILALLLLPGMLALKARAGEAKPAKPASTAVAEPGNNITSPGMETNGITARIQAGLDGVKAKVDAAVKSLQEAAAANQVQGALSVSNVATQIRNLATSDLGDGSALVKEADKLAEKMRRQISEGRTRSADPKEEAREAYAQGSLMLEAELSKLIDRRSSVSRVRSELQRQANALEARARSIAWLEDANQMKVASKALEDALSEALAFAGKIDALINQMGNAQGLAIQ